eukprot:scaffold416740_cov50-Prasinocladus_malaysianus.AAC.1
MITLSTPRSAIPKRAGLSLLNPLRALTRNRSAVGRQCRPTVQRSVRCKLHNRLKVKFRPSVCSMLSIISWCRLV